MTLENSGSFQYLMYKDISIKPILALKKTMRALSFIIPGAQLALEIFWFRPLQRWHAACLLKLKNIPMLQG